MPPFVHEYRDRRVTKPEAPLFECEYEIIPFYDVNGVGLLYFASYLPGNTLSEDEYFRELPPGDVYIGIGSNEERGLCASRLRAVRANMPSCIAPTAFVARDAEIESGAIVCAGAVVGSRSRIGRDTIINTLSSVDHDCVLGASPR